MNRHYLRRLDAHLPTELTRLAADYVDHWADVLGDVLIAQWDDSEYEYEHGCSRYCLYVFFDVAMLPARQGEPEITIIIYGTRTSTDRQWVYKNWPYGRGQWTCGIYTFANRMFEEPKALADELYRVYTDDCMWPKVIFMRLIRHLRNYVSIGARARARKS